MTTKYNVAKREVNSLLNNKYKAYHPKGQSAEGWRESQIKYNYYALYVGSLTGDSMDNMERLERESEGIVYDHGIDWDTYTAIKLDAMHDAAEDLARFFK